MLIFAIFLALFLAGCAATNAQITEEERAQLADAATPYTSDAVYDQALITLGAYINSELDKQRIFQPKTIANAAGGQELPVNVTDMVITGLSRLSGNKLVVAPFDPEYIVNDRASGGRGRRILPNIVVGGSITEFDKEIEGESGDANLDAIVDRGKPDTNVSGEASKGLKVSRVSIDLYLIDYRTHAVIPGASVSNTIHVAEIEKDKEFAFSIYGNGIGIGGKIKSAQGFHRAVRNLVDYSLLQLLGRYYNFPYWRALGVDETDTNVMASLKKSFMTRDERGQNIIIQNLLNEYTFGASVVNAATGAQFSGKIAPSGDLDEKSLTYIEAFKAKYGVKADTASEKGELYAALIRHLPIGAAKEVNNPDLTAAQSEKLRNFFNSKNRFEKVTRRQAIEGY
ncbi:MAG: hypothetical protein LBU39_06495 [Desulfobulbaceae bacterium]|nr:hypothetical protein [Desulfobulbaceae bacterium]